MPLGHLYLSINYILLYEPLSAVFYFFANLPKFIFFFN